MYKFLLQSTSNKWIILILLLLIIKIIIIVIIKKNNNNNNNNSNNSLSMSWGKSGNPIHDINKQNINRNEAVVFFDVSLVDFCYALTH